MSNAPHPYTALTPDSVMQAMTELGLWPDGRLLAMGSYENRVYRAHLDEPVQGHTSVVLKFYRPGRWSREQILEEHAFAAELAAAEVPAVAPLVVPALGGALGGQVTTLFIVTLFVLILLGVALLPTILHALHHGSKLLPEMSRHYYDTMMLAEKGVADVALVTPDLLAKVVLNKSMMFADTKASYGTAVFGSLRLVPTDELRVRLNADYDAMADMFMIQPPTFDEMMGSIASLEASELVSTRTRTPRRRSAASASIMAGPGTK